MVFLLDTDTHVLYIVQLLSHVLNYLYQEPMKNAG